MKISLTPAQLKQCLKLLAENETKTIIEIVDKRKTEKEIKARIEYFEEQAHNHSSVTNAAFYLNQAYVLRWVLGELN